MARHTSHFMKGVGTGIAAGIAIGALSVAGSRYVSSHKKTLKKNAGKAIHAMGDLLENVQYMWK